MNRRTWLWTWGCSPLLAGCSAATAGRQTLSVASFPDLDRGARIAAPRFEATHPGVRVKVTALAHGDYPTAMTTSLAAGANLPDVMAMDAEIIGPLAESAGLEDLSKPPFASTEDLARLPAFALTAARSHSGAMAALPVDVGPGALFYRSDLLQQAGLTEAALTDSWEGFIETGRQLRARTGAYLLADAGDIKDIVMRVGLQAGQGVYFDAAGKAQVNNPRFQRAFELARAARQAGIDARVAAWSNEWVEGFRRGRLASQMMGAWLGGHLKNWIVPQQVGRWRSAPLPGRAFASWGGSFYAIPRQAPHKAWAWDFIRLLALDRAQQLAAFKAMDAFPALVEAQRDAFLDEPIDFLGGQAARRQWRDAVQRMPALEVDRFDATARLVVNGQLEAVLVHNKPIPQALADAQAGIERRVRRY